MGRVLEVRDEQDINNSNNNNVYISRHPGGVRKTRSNLHKVDERKHNFSREHTVCALMNMTGNVIS